MMHRGIYFILLAIPWVFLLCAVSAFGDSEEQPVKNYPKLHLSYSGGLSIGNATQDIKDAFRKSGFDGVYYGWLGRTYNPRDDSKTTNQSIDLFYRLAERTQIGAGYKGIPDEKIIGYGAGDIGGIEHENVSGIAYYLMIVYLPLPVGNLKSPQWEVALGGGVSYFDLTIDGDLGSYWDGTAYVYSEPFSYGEGISGAVFRGSIDYYPNPFISFQFKMSGFVMQKAKVLRQSFSTDTVTRELVAHRINFSTLELALGIGVHL
jgi:hypothetical protein